LYLPKAQFCALLRPQADLGAELGRREV